MDACQHCSLRGKFDECQSVECHIHDSWYVDMIKSGAKPTDSQHIDGVSYSLIEGTNQCVGCVGRDENTGTYNSLCNSLGHACTRRQNAIWVVSDPIKNTDDSASTDCEIISTCEAHGKQYGLVSNPSHFVECVGCVAQNSIDLCHDLGRCGFGQIWIPLEKK